MVTQAGTVIADRYLLREQIGAGSTGVVWRAVDSRLDRPVVVKLLAGDVEPPSRSTPLVTVYDRGTADGVAFIVMEHPSGGSLRARLDAEGPLTERQTMTLVTHIARALHEAHTAGVVHRDLRPGHLLVRSDGTVAVIDAGLAPGWWTPGEPQTTRWAARASYLAPEQVRGAPVTAATDVYALGVVAYECLTGRVPLRADGPAATAALHATAEPPPLPDHISPATRDLIARALAKDPAARPSAAEMAAAAEAAAAKARPDPVDDSLVDDSLVDDLLVDKEMLRAPTVQLPDLPSAAATSNFAADVPLSALPATPALPPPYWGADNTTVVLDDTRNARLLYVLVAAAVVVLLVAVAFLVPELAGRSDHTGPGGSKVTHALDADGAGVDVGSVPNPPTVSPSVSASPSPASVRPPTTSRGTAASTQALASPTTPPPPAPPTFKVPVNQMTPEYQDGTCVYRVMFGNFGSAAYAKAHYYAGACGGTTIEVAALRDGFNLTWEAAKGQELGVTSDSCGSAYEEQATSNPTPAYGVGARITFGETGHVVVFMDGTGPTPPIVKTC
jgi:eukaryotic-like serine/threonine-protein kinase